MRERLAEWAPYLGGLGIALWVVAGILRLLNQTIDPAILLGLVGVGVILVALFVINRQSEVRGAVTGRTAVYGSSVLLMSLAFVGIVIIANWLVVRSWHQRWDVTAGKSRTLSDLTISVLQKDVHDPITITGFFTNRQNSTAIQSLPDLRQKVSDYKQYNDKITFREVDPDANPQLAAEYEVVQDGTIVVEHGSGTSARREKVFSSDENTLTNAILKVIKTQQQVIYFITGHGEHSLTDPNATGLSLASTLLTETNFKVQSLNLSTTFAGAPVSGTVTNTVGGQLPLDTNVVVIAGPTKPFSAEEAGRIKDYLDKGGRVLVMFELGADPGLKDLLASYGVEYKNDLVIDPGQSVRGNAAMPVVTTFPSHEINTSLESFGVVFPRTRSLSVAKNPPAGRLPTELFKSTASACSKDFEAIKGSTQVPACDSNADPKGPFTLGIAVETAPNTNDPNVKGRLVVIGTTDLATDNILQLQGANGDQLLWQNAIKWLAGQSDLIAIPPKASSQATLSLLTGTDNALILWSNILLIPAAIILVGGLIWWRRR
jgi:ABC-type uncharacterized transport system involved in gliding motility auxiliary subunit